MNWLDKLLARLRHILLGGPSAPTLSNARFNMADRTLQVSFAWDKKDQEGQAEQLALTGPRAKMWITGGAFTSRTELTPVTVTIDTIQPNPALLAGKIGADANIIAGVVYQLQAAIIDDDGSTGAISANLPYTLQDSGPTAPTLSAPSSTPKP